jgi:microcystin-dependent protein
MPRNSSGVYSLPSGNPVVSGTTIDSTWANPTMTDLGAEITGSLPRNGTAPMTGPLVLNADAVQAKEATTLQQLNAAVNASSNFLPAGALMDFAVTSIPAGWLACNGAAVSRTTYAQLFGIIGTLYGPGNGSTTFNLPDFRGKFKRGWDDGAGIDPGRAFGTIQAAANAAHSHSIGSTDHAHAVSLNPHTHTVTDGGHAHTVTVTKAGAEVSAGSGLFSAVDQSVVTTSEVTGLTIDSTGNFGGVTLNASTGLSSTGSSGSESRPINLTVVTCIKAYGGLVTDGLGSMAFQNSNAVNITGGTIAGTTTGAFAALSCSSAPVNPNDVARLADIGGNVGSILSGDQQLLVIDNANPVIPIIRPLSNQPFGMVKLDAGNKIPTSLLPTVGVNYQGPWDASGGQTPSQAYPVATFLDGDMYIVDTAGVLTLYDSSGVSTNRAVVPGDQVIYATSSNIFPVPGWYLQPASSFVYSVEKTSFTGSAIMPVGETAQRDLSPNAGYLRFNTESDHFEGYNGVEWKTVVQDAPTAATVPFTPVGGIIATDVQAALSELDTEKQNSATAVTKDSSTGAAQLPTGTTAQRPGSPVYGQTRANSTLNRLEWWDGTAWTPFGVVQTTGLKNRIINGDCRIAQRGNIAAALGTWNYGGADRIRAALFGYGSASGTIARAIGVGSPTGYGQSISGVTATGTGQVYFSTLIESLNTYDLSGKTITVSVNAYQDSGSSINAVIQLFKPPTADNFVSGNTLLASETVSVPSGGGGAQLALTTTLGATDAANGLGVYVYFPTGAITSKIFTTWDWQLEEGTTVTSLDRRPIALELAMCQRYFQKLTSGVLVQSLTTEAYGYLPFVQEMRDVPTFSGGSSTFTIYGVGVVSTLSNPVYQTTRKNGVHVGVTFASMGAVGKPGLYICDLSASIEIM